MNILEYSKKIEFSPLERRLIDKYHRVNCKGMFKYYIPKNVYDLFDYSMQHNHWYVDFFTLNNDYKEIWMYFYKNKGRYGDCRLGECGWDDLNQCYCLEIFMPMVFMGIKEFNSPYRYQGLETYLNNAIKLGYTDTDEITRDWESYHERIGRKFQDIGLLSKKK